MRIFNRFYSPQSSKIVPSAQSVKPKIVSWVFGIMKDMEKEKDPNDIDKQIDDILEGKTNLDGEAKRLKLEELFRRLNKQNENKMRKIPRGEIIDT